MQTDFLKKIAVSVIVPMKNEEKYISTFLESLSETSYPKSLIEVLIMDGMSEDKSVELIHKFIVRNPDISISIIENRLETIPCALNLGIQNARHEYLLRMDCHATYDKDYIKNSLYNLQNIPGAVGVGGVISLIGVSDTGKSIALAMQSRLGNGGSNYRTANKIVDSDTIWCGCWTKANVIRAGMFDVSKDANEDFEFNQRLKSLGKIYTCPDIIASQFVRESFKALFYQYHRYGYWKAIDIKIKPKNFQARQVALVLFFTFLLLSLLVAAINPIPFLILIVCYASAVVISPAKLNTKSTAQYLKICTSILIMHIAWFLGFSKALINSKKQGATP